MPGLGWAILVLAAVIIFILGLVFAFLHFKKAMTTVSGTASAISKRISAMQEDSRDLAQRDMTPSFTKPIGQTAQAYSRAHSDIIARRDRRRSRHHETWKAWAQTDQKHIDQLAEQLNITEDED